MRRKLLSSEDGDSEEPLINLTPLIDVVFVVLITFMILAPVLDIDWIQLAPAGPGSKKESTNSPMTISIRSDNSIWFQKNQMTLKELEYVLRSEKMRYPHQSPQIIPDKMAHFGTYQEVKNVLEICGFEQMDIVLQPQ